jgi:transcriptional regulator with XRE-family HTH domain
MLGIVSAELPAMSEIKSVAQWMVERGMSLADVVAASQLEPRVVEAIAQGRYTPSPDQRQRLADALNVASDRIAWGHVAPVEHMYGHGPQFGRSP